MNLTDFINEIWGKKKGYPLSVVFEKLWKLDEVPSDQRKGNIEPIFKKCKKEDPGNYQPASPLCPVRSWNRSSWKICQNM